MYMTTSTTPIGVHHITFSLLTAAPTEAHSLYMHVSTCSGDEEVKVEKLSVKNP